MRPIIVSTSLIALGAMIASPVFAQDQASQQRDEEGIAEIVVILAQQLEAALDRLHA